MNLEEQWKEKVMEEERKSHIRQFDTGATRDTEEGKLDFEGFLSPIVIKAFGEYMNEHCKQSDGQLRASDNWQKGFGPDHYDVCMKSLWRHFEDLWLEHRGWESREGIEKALMGILFNTMAYAHQYLIDNTAFSRGEKDGSKAGNLLS
jgi:hypothetical protein